MNAAALTAIDRIIANFDFEKVHHYMSLVKWSWCYGEGPDGVPTIEQLKAQARQLLVDTYNEQYGRQTGGFVTEYYGSLGKGTTECMHLHFSIASQFKTF